MWLQSCWFAGRSSYFCFIQTAVKVICYFIETLTYEKIRACLFDEGEGNGASLSDIKKQLSDLNPIDLLSTIQNRIHRDMHLGIH